MPRYIVETVSSFKHKYVIEAESKEAAHEEWIRLDCDDAESLGNAEISQVHTGEHVLRATEADLGTIVEATDDYLKGIVRAQYSE